MHGRYLPGSDEAAHEVAIASLKRQIDGRWGPFLATKNLTQIGGLAEMGSVPADQNDGIARILERDCRHDREVGQETDAANSRGGQDRLAVGLVVERDI